MTAGKKKLILVIPSLQGGGAEKVASILCRSFGEMEPPLDVLLVLLDRVSKAPVIPNIRIEYLNFNPRGNAAYSARKFLALIMALARIFRHEGPCTVLSFMDYANIVSLLANRLAGGGNRVVISVRTRPSAQTGKYAANYRERIVGVLVRRLYNRADGVISVSRDVAQDLADNFHVNRKLIHVIHNPVDLPGICTQSQENVADAAFAGEVPIILAVGRLAREKGFDSLLRAFAMVRSRSEAKLAILGEGAEEANLKRLSIELGIEDNVLFLGFQENPYKYMTRATVFVLSSLYEGFPNVLVEAMACGIPVVATRCFADIEEIVEHESSGFLVEVGDLQGMAESLLQLLSDRELRGRFAAAAKPQVQRLAVDAIAAQYLKVLGLPSGIEAN